MDNKDEAFQPRFPFKKIYTKKNKNKLNKNEKDNHIGERI